jgi:hypothetical protein
MEAGAVGEYSGHDASNSRSSNRAVLVAKAALAKAE